MKLIWLLMILAIISSSCSAQDSPDPKTISHRPATAAGMFYPSNADELRIMIEKYIGSDKPVMSENEIFGIVSPHAGYVYSGLVAGKAYKEIKGRKYEAIIIIGPSHTQYFEGSSVFKGDAYVTPLGVAKVDKELANEIGNYGSGVKLSMDGHNWNEQRSEHSIEVQIPFIQVTQPNTPIVPICMGSQDSQTSDILMRAIIKATKKLNRKILVIASTDLSHFHDYDSACKLDSNVVNAFNRYDYFMMSANLYTRRWEACGGGPVITTMMVSEQLGANQSNTLLYATSGDVPEGEKSKDRVVGYMSGCLYKDNNKKLDEIPDLTPDERKKILQAAKNGVELSVYGKMANPVELEETPNLNQQFSAFVTIKKNGDLRACMGHTFPAAPMLYEVEDVAKMAASKDYRFGPVEKSELPQIEYEVTLMSRLRRIFDINEIEIGKHGLYIRFGNNAGLLLPQVATERNWDAKTFLENVCYKAGLPPNAYKEPDVELFVFSASIIH